MRTGLAARWTEGYCFQLNDVGMVSWGCRKQPTVALSTAEAEYMALSAASQEAMFLNGILTEMAKVCGLIYEDAIMVKDDSRSCIAMAHNSGAHQRRKHIDARHH
eukprot:GHVS01041812.1.p1 GENE.GHVS01041812.1~~GHVS01041812.1.p1  ORF type:complete len:105 (+),score=14.78 GHVS01041812.1:1064-1378(+)